MSVIKTLWTKLLIQPILNLLVLLYVFTGNLGLAIILLTLIIRAVLLPLTLPGMKNMKKQQDLQPELNKLKKKYKNDKQKLAEAQMALFKKHGFNPAAGCLTQLPMLIVLIALYQVIGLMTTGDVAALNELIYFSSYAFTEPVNTAFLIWDLGVADPYFILPVVAGLLQFVNSKQMAGRTQKGTELAKKTAEKEDDLAYNMQKQMLYIMPLMTFVIGLKLPAGVMLYIITTTIFSIVQTYFTYGGYDKAKLWLKKKNI